MERVTVVLLLLAFTLAPAAAASTVDLAHDGASPVGGHVVASATVASPRPDPAVPGVQAGGNVHATTPSGGLRSGAVALELPNLRAVPNRALALLGLAPGGQGGPAAQGATQASVGSGVGGQVLLGFLALGLLALAAQALGALATSAVTLASRLEGRELLEDPNRARIHALLTREPGLATTDIAERLDLAWGTVTHHLAKLESRRLVVSRRYGKYRRYFVNGAVSDPRTKDRIAALQRPRTAEVAQVILEHPGISQKEVGERLGVAPSTVLWHVRRLRQVGLVEKVRQGRSVAYHPCGALRGDAGSRWLTP